MVATVDSTPWLTEARKFVGLREIIGSKHEAKILQFFAEAGHPNVRDDETSWCAAFANAMLVRAGWAGTGSLLARSFLTWGTALDAPKVGAVAVFRRGKEPWQGHVAIVVGEGLDTVRVLGGNQGNAVNIISMPKADVLGYRWPAIKLPKPKSSPVKDAVKVGTGGLVVGGGTAAAEAGLSWPAIAGIVIGVALLAVVAWLIVRWWRNRPRKDALAPTLSGPLASEDAAAPPPTGDPSPPLTGDKQSPSSLTKRAPVTNKRRAAPAAKPKPAKAKPAAKKRRA